MTEIEISRYQPGHKIINGAAGTIGLATRVTAVTVALLLYGCDAIVDCLDNDGPDFSSRELQPATLNQVYQGSIRASVQNEPFDSRFDYNFEIIDGALPGGISTSQTGQTFLFTGTPTELGTFDFEVNVFVDDGQTAINSGLCFRNETKDFSLVVQQDNS